MLMARNASMTDGGITPVFRLSGQYDRYGRQVGWLARTARTGWMYTISASLLGELVDHGTASCGHLTDSTGPSC